MVYVYKAPKAPAKVTRADGYTITLKPCGTEAAYQRHLKKGEAACDPCLTAHRMVGRGRDRANTTRPKRVLAPCGTPAAYSRHLRNKEPVDKACRAANTAYHASLRAAKAKGISNGT